MNLKDGIYEQLGSNPFYLSRGEIKWVNQTLAKLDMDARVAQLFNIFITSDNDDFLNQISDFEPGAITIAPWLDRSGVAKAIELVRVKACVEPLVSADIEGGAISMSFMTPMPNQLAMAAAAEPALYHRAACVMAREASAVGVNWSFAPVLDINADFRSAIVATRSFGSDRGTIGTLSLQNIDAFQRNGIAATAKHWPGEGFDSRDQHLVTTINPLSVDEWQKESGALFRSAIEAGVLTIMSAHIAFPAYAEANGAVGLEKFRPASISPILNKTLLRDELGFNGLVVSDASVMGGLTSWADRPTFLPELIQNGCDMILFSPDMAVDLDILERAIADGRLTTDRIEAAVIRILALKAVCARPNSESVAAGETDRTIVESLARRAPTLVKDVNQLLPITPADHRRILLIQETGRIGFAEGAPPRLKVGELLACEGFEVIDHVPGSQPPEVDLIIYLLAQESLLTKSHIYLDWAAMLGPVDQAMQRTWHRVPTILISFGQPYYLFDAPRMPCVINAYCAVDTIQRAVVRKLTGHESFDGISPVDAFCGLDDAHF